MSASFTITEDEFNILFDVMLPSFGTSHYALALARMKEAGYIKKSAYDEAAEAYEEIMAQFRTSSETNCWTQAYIRDFIEKLWTALQEERGKKNS